MTRDTNPLKRKPQTSADEKIQNRQADRNPKLSIKDAIQITILGIEIVRPVPTEPFVSEEKSIDNGQLLLPF